MTFSETTLVGHASRPSPGDAGFADWLRENLKPSDLDGGGPDDVALLRPFGLAEQHPPGSLLFRGGEPVEAVYIIEDGYVDVFTQRPLERRILRTCGPGCTLGELPLRRQAPPHPYGAVTRTAVAALRLSRATIEALIEVQPAICFRFLRLVACCVARTEQRLLELSGRSALERTVQFVLREAEEHKSTTIAATQDDVAASLGLSRQTVNRVLGELEGLGLIVRRRKGLTILELQRLEEIANPAVLRSSCGDGDGSRL